MNRVEALIGHVSSRLGITIARSSSLQNRLPIEATDEDRFIIEAVRPFTMTSSERVWSLLQAVRYVQDEHVPGAFVECGVWRGGSVMAMARKLQALGNSSRDLWLYDTFEGMTPPTANDIEAISGTSAEQLLATTDAGDGNNVWCIASQEDVQQNLATTEYPLDRQHYVRGDVAQTLLSNHPDQIALLRLDTDWHESTKAELEILYPRLAKGGVCILDDYGHWAGARKAVDDYFIEHGPRPLMHPIDFSGRIFIKTHD